MLASLPMYDLPEVRAATDGFWNNIAKSMGVSIPLTRGEDWTSPWREPQLLLSQTCGYPFTHEFTGQLTYVATPHYDADGCKGPNYRSIVFAKTATPLDEFRTLSAAYNSNDSMSGYLALKLVFAPYATTGGKAFFGKAIATRSHIASLSAVQEGTADVCAIDCVTVALLKRYRPAALQGLIEIARSPSVPGLPYVTRGGDPTQLQRAITASLPSPQAHNLLIKGASILKHEDYNVIVELESSIANKSILPET